MRKVGLTFTVRDRLRAYGPHKTLQTVVFVTMALYPLVEQPLGLGLNMDSTFDL